MHEVVLMNVQPFAQSPNHAVLRLVRRGSSDPAHVEGSHQEATIFADTKHEHCFPRQRSIRRRAEFDKRIAVTNATQKI